MKIYQGIAALSDFRRAKLLQKLQALEPGIRDVSAEYVHFADVDRTLSKADDARIAKLATYGTPYQETPKGLLYLVVPRAGTISPWSSKATDIIRNSGIAGVKRIERGVAYYVEGEVVDDVSVAAALHDRMTETVLPSIDALEELFAAAKPKALRDIDISGGHAALAKANVDFGFALADDEIDYLVDAYKALGRNPTDAELMMFAQVNSEHCRHKIFNADWTIDGKAAPKSLFKMIKNTYEKGGQGVLSAYKDNAAILQGPLAGRFFAEPDGSYCYHHEPTHMVIKAETHNHPTAIAPIPGAATGIGGEIRDEAATGQGAKTKAGLAGFSVSNLHIPDAERPWEGKNDKPDRIASALDIMLEAPIGGASFANEFGRPNLTGYFRTFEQQVGDTVWGYHKPIMIAGGLGNIRYLHTQKAALPVGTLVIQLGGPSMLIGLGGGAASSMQTGQSDETLDFASVQRGNGEMERRTNQAIDACWALGENSPILSIHDVGAGGLSNALPELVHDAGRGAIFQLRDIPNAEPGLSPMEIWCNESQERYVLGIAPESLEEFTAICERERCPFAVVGILTEEEQLVVEDSLLKSKTVDLPMDVLFGKPPKMSRSFKSSSTKQAELKLDDIKLEDAVERVLKLPSVGSKSFLITIGDRTVGGLVTRDQMVGPWQVPVSDVAVTAVSYDADFGEAMAMGERTPLALINAPAAARMAVAEAVSNCVAADVQQISDIKLSANWMAAVGYGNEDQALYESVRAVGEEFCPALDITIPVGKDSLSMRTSWDDKSVTSPVSLIISAFAPVNSVQRTLTPQLSVDSTASLVLIAPSAEQRLGGSALAQVYNQLGSIAPDADAEEFKDYLDKLLAMKKAQKILAYHDRSDGGLLAVVLEMAFASRCGLDLNLSDLDGSTLEKLFNEELGAVIQVAAKDLETTLKVFGDHATVIGKATKDQTIKIIDGQTIYKNSRSQLQRWWSDTSYRLQKLRDNPDSADQEFAVIADDKDPGLSPQVSFKLKRSKYNSRPKVAIFREEGVNGHVEMAAAFDRAGFDAVDVHLSDIETGRFSLDDFVGLAACGGFSYGDVLGSGQGWAKSILFHKDLRAKFEKFFARPDTFSLGVCNGCQMFAALKEIIPGAANWPTFLKNASEQFEARLVSVKLEKSPSILFKGMEGSILPVPTAHGEGRAVFDSKNQEQRTKNDGLIVARYVDNHGKITENYPANPNGSPDGITALTTPDGRATIIMPHPERVHQTRTLSWHPADWDDESPWMQIFYNARQWVQDQTK
ncbi:MAG TPA: phosphoribosylformylglycinamidine synthase [Candidatus Saccharimonadales bacterium]|nr:phosphoribosylformylglycinamidine synthase [Candidatus Saccharimonadales bacterium]